MRQNGNKLYETRYEILTATHISAFILQTYHISHKAVLLITYSDQNSDSDI